MDKIVEVNQAAIENHLGEMVRSTVEETLNSMLDAEADRLCNAERYEGATEKRQPFVWLPPFDRGEH